MMSTSYEDYGLSSLWNWQSFGVAYYGEKSDIIAKYQTAWGSDIDIDAFVTVCRTRIEAFYFGGAFADISVSDMLNGYENDVAAKINGGDYFEGDFFGLSALT